MATSTHDLAALVARARTEAQKAGELRPPRVGRISSTLPGTVRSAIGEDLASGAYHAAAAEAVANDAELTQR